MTPMWAVYIEFLFVKYAHHFFNFDWNEEKPLVAQLSDVTDYTS